MKQKKKILLVFTLVIAMLCCPMAAFAADSPVTETRGISKVTPLSVSDFQAMEVAPGVEMQVMSSAAGITAMVRTFENLVDAVEADIIDSAYLMNDIQMESSLVLTKDFTIETGGVDRSLYSAPKERHFVMDGTGITLDLEDSVILDGNNEGPAGILGLGRHFTITGGTIQNGTTSAAIHAEGIETGNVTISNTKILNQSNDTAGKGGAIFFSGQNSGGLILEDCIIRGNTAKGTGAAIYFAGGSTFEIYSTVIEDNINLSGIGGAVYYPENYGNFMMRNVTLNNNLPTSVSNQDYASQEYTVTYYPNSGEGTPFVDSGLAFGTTYTVLNLETVGFVKERYILESWNTKIDGSGDTYEIGETITVEKDLQLYAQWKYDGPGICTIAFHPNTGQGSEIFTVRQGSDFTFKDAEEYGISKMSYIFVEWNTETDGSGTSYSVDETITVDENLFLYAIWRFDSDPYYMVAYDPVMAGFQAQIINVYERDPIHIVMDPKDLGYEFEAMIVTGFIDTKTDELYRPGDSIEVTRDMILKANWAPDF